VDETLGEADGVYIVDESGFPEKGKHSVGVTRQWCGVLDKVENCQVGVFGAYASRRGYTLVDHHLFLRKAWFDDEHLNGLQRK
jgi:SRSO17 transposase